MAQTSVITGFERRRRWSEEEKLQLLAEPFRPGGSVADVARRADICTSLLYRWRQLLRAAPEANAFVPAIVGEPLGSPAKREPDATIYVAFEGRVSVSIAAGASPALVVAVLEALR